MHITEIQYFNSVNHHKNAIKFMHDLKTNFDKILQITNQALKGTLNADGNLQHYPRKPKLSDNEIITLSICQECLSIDSENWFLAKLKSDYRTGFTKLVHITNYNRRRKRLSPWTQEVNKILSGKLRQGEDAFIVDSIPVPVCKIVREKQLKICRENFETAPDKGYSAIFKQYYIGYKLHLLIGVNGVYADMEMTKASVHDAHYLNEIKHSGINNCLLLGDKGYISEKWQLDLFTSAGIEPQVPQRSNQKNDKPWPGIYKYTRRRIEVYFAQLCDQMMLKRNYAKTFNGLKSRTIAKVTSVTVFTIH